MKINKSILKTLISAIYPNKCICCSEIINEGSCICNQCNTDIERNNLNDLCLECGLEKDNCVCKYNIYRFNSLISVFKNTGLARKAYYSYKFGKKQHYVHFFANEICNAVKQLYADIKFDYICAVPSAKKYGYDHSGYIAKELSDLLKIPCADKLLSCAKRTKSQHRSSIKERLMNTDGKYKFNYRVDNACVLLIDDIKTTGATIDECAKILLFAGAQSVYCATALGTTNIETKN